MADNSENSITIPENVATIPDNATPDAPPQAEEVPAPANSRPKTRGRPWGSKDGKPRIRRVPMVIKQDEEPAAPTEPVEPAPKTVHFEVEETKSPRTVHREHVQTMATERRKMAQARQAHYESLLAHNLSW